MEELILPDTINLEDDAFSTLTIEQIQSASSLVVHRDPYSHLAALVQQSELRAPVVPNRYRASVS